MYQINCLNPIADVGLKNFSDKYQITADVQEADGILVRSASMHEMEIPAGLLAVARAGAGVNNIPLDKCAEKGVVVFNTPGANANGVKELVLAGMLLAARDVIVHIQHMLHGTAQIPGGVHGQVGIIAVYIHSQRHGGVGHFHTDGPQADNAQLFALDLPAGKRLFAFLHGLRNVLVILIIPAPANPSANIAACQQKPCQQPAVKGKSAA